MGYDIAGEIVDNAVREVPEAILEAPEVRGAIEYLTSALADYSDYIDPDGDELEEELAKRWFMARRKFLRTTSRFCWMLFTGRECSVRILSWRTLSLR